MSGVQYASFVKNEFQLVSVFLALRSLQLLEICDAPPIVLVPTPLIETIEKKYPDFKVKNMIKKLGGDLKEAFSAGFNPRNSFRAALQNLARKTNGKPMLYFAPYTVFFGDPLKKMAISDVAVSRSPDQYWPIQELYGASMEEIWGAIIAHAGVDPQTMLDDFPTEYWRRYPCASTHLIYAKDPIAFANAHMEDSKELIEAQLSVLEGQGRDLVEASIAVTAMKLNGVIVPLEWDEEIIAHDNLIQLVLRLRPQNVENFNIGILDFQPIRRFLKRIYEYKAVFYINKLPNLRGKFDDIESAFLPLRINQLIERRGVEKGIKSLIREMKKTEDEAEGVKKTAALAAKLAAEGID